MASQDRIHRLLNLVVVLQSGRSFNSVQLSQECGVSRRTIFRDLNTLQESGIPVRFDRVKQSYVLHSPVYIPPTDFKIDEALSLAVLCNHVSVSETGIPFLQPARTAAMKVLSALPGKLRELVSDFAAGMEIRVDPHNPLKESADIYELLSKSLSQRKQIRIHYKSLMPDEPDEFSTLLNPYRLLFGRRSWYVIGRSSRHRAVRTFHLGRIRRAEMLDSGYRIPERFTLDRFLGNAWFLIRDREKAQRIVVRFQPMVARNVADVQWHKSQKVVWNDDGTLDFQVTVDGLREIQWWILGYGDQAEVIKPKALRDAVATRIQAMAAIYGSSSKKSPRRKAKKRKSK